MFEKQWQQQNLEGLSCGQRLVTGTSAPSWSFLPFVTPMPSSSSSGTLYSGLTFACGI